MTKIETLAKLVETNEINSLVSRQSDCEANRRNARTRIVPGRKYTKIDVGTSGRFMVENETEKVFGIKAYGQINRGHYYGTIDGLSAKLQSSPFATRACHGLCD